MCTDLGGTACEPILHTQPRAEHDDCEQHHQVFKIQEKGIFRRRDRNPIYTSTSTQESSQKHHALNMRLRFPISLKRRRGRREERTRKNKCRLEGKVGKGTDDGQK